MPFTLVTFNVKNLLEPWKAKLDWIADVLRACDADVVALQEVGSAELVRAVTERVGGAWSDPVVGTADARGIRCALVSRAPLLESRVHVADALSFPAFRAGDPAPFGDRIPLRRGVVHARVDAPGVGPVDVLVAHFKSRRAVPMRDASGGEVPWARARDRAEGELRSLVWRAAEALHVRGIVDGILAGDPSARVAVVGDFNDVPDSPTLRALRGRESDAGALVDCTLLVDAAARFSAVHGGVRAQIDHALVTAPLRARLVHAEFRNAALREPDGTTADDAPSVDSDHAPLVVRFG